MALPMLAAKRYCRTQPADPIRLYYMPIIGRLYRARVARCLSLLPSGARVLDIGYGSGASFISLGERFDQVHGVDLHNRSTDVYRTFAGLSLDLHLRQGDILRLPYDDDTFDAALAVSIHEHLPVEDQATAFAEVLRVLKPGGAYVVGVPGFNHVMALGFLALGFNIHAHHLSSETAVLDAMGGVFDVDATIYLPTFWPKSMTCYVSARGVKRSARRAGRHEA